MPMFPGMGAGMDPRQMSMMMRKFGIDVRDIEGVERVIVHTATKDYVFDKASVSVMKAQGVETWQVSGKPRILEKGAGGKGAGQPGATAGATGTSGVPDAALAAPDGHTVPSHGDAPPITDEDVALVMKETGKPRAEARAALEACGGDLAEAILKLS